MNGRRALKEAIATTMNVFGARQMLAAVRRHAAGGRRILVFGYHRVCRDFATESARSIDSCLISRKTFARHVAFLAEHFEIATMSRAMAVMAGHERAARDLAVITFDDGYADVLENALPVLAEFNVPATIYVSSSVVSEQGFFPHDRLYALLLAWQESESLVRASATPWAHSVLASITPRSGGAHRWLHDLIAERSPAELERLIDELSRSNREPSVSAAALSWEGVRELANAGWEIGAHTTGHCVLTHLDSASMELDLKQCRVAIERATKQPVVHFAYCNGYYNKPLIQALQHTGYQSAVTTEDRLNRLGDDPFLVARRVLWEGSALGTLGRTSSNLLACQLDDAWSALGLTSSESGERPVAAEPREMPARRLA